MIITTLRNECSPGLKSTCYEEGVVEVTVQIPVSLNILSLRFIVSSIQTVYTYDSLRLKIFSETGTCSVGRFFASLLIVLKLLVASLLLF